MINWQQRFDQALADTLKAGEDWESWFEPDSPNSGDQSCDYETPDEVAQLMLVNGATYWSSPAWLREIPGVIRRWAIDGELVKVHLVAQWLVTTIPTDPLDTDLAPLLYAVADGNFCEAFQSLACQWPHSLSYYGKTLNLRMSAITADLQTQMSASISTALIMKRLYPGTSLQDHLEFPTVRDIA